jgi:hypothetical protein
VAYICFYYSNPLVRERELCCILSNGVPVRAYICFYYRNPLVRERELCCILSNGVPVYCDKGCR